MLLRNGTNEYVESVRKLVRHLETTAKSSKKNVLFGRTL